jgi:hypothetical protein
MPVKKLEDGEVPTEEYLALVEAHRAREQRRMAKLAAQPTTTTTTTAAAPTTTTTTTTTSSSQPRQSRDEDDESGPEAGPAPLTLPSAMAATAPDLKKMFGKDLLKGEGAAMAEFVNKNQRIPRRGEIGLTAEEIANYEKLGFVMSGSRHKKMTAVRLRKEGQVLSSSERIDQVLFNAQAKAERENKVVEELRKLAKERELKK